MLYYEKKSKVKGFSFVIGIDEAGRGPWAGPVVAAAVRYTSFRMRARIADSKVLTPRQRERAFFEIYRNAAVGIGVMNEGVVDAFNILQATRFAMEQAVANLFYCIRKKIAQRKVMLLVDGAVSLDLPYTTKNIIDGDAKSFSIASASIVAKVVRDRMMCAYHKVYPRYTFANHKGYGTKQHARALQQFGVCPLHRRSFRPVKKFCT